VRILLTASASYVPPRGGATRSNLVWLDHLAAAGHACRIVCASLARDAAGRQEQMRDEEIEPGAARAADGVEYARRGPIEVWSAADPVHRVQALRNQIGEFHPDWVLVSSEDLGHMLLREAWQSAPGRVVYLAHTPQFYPFGPASWNPDTHAAGLVARAAAVVAIGRSTAAYIERHTGRAATVIHPPIYGSGPYRDLACFERGLVAMINPCAVKGIGIFLETARRLLEVAFGALPGWGTTREDRRAMAELANIALLPNCRDIEQLLERTRLLLMPSLWYEGFGLIVMEAMLRGIPVVSSDAGGLVEAKEGTGFVIPVRPIERYDPVFDEHGMPRPVTAPQEIGPWVDAVRALLGDRALYEEESRRSRDAALRFVAGLDAARMEQMLAGLEPAPEPVASAPRSAVESLSAERRALLLKRLRNV
jgi:glycosyltransferase involved in cell wall biosynthesis